MPHTLVEEMRVRLEETYQWLTDPEVRAAVPEALLAEEIQKTVARARREAQDTRAANRT